MKILILILSIFTFFGCKQPKNEENDIESLTIKPKVKKETLLSETTNEEFQHNRYNRKSKNFIYKLEEIPNKDSNAYKIFIYDKNGEKLFDRILNTRPKASQINYCNDSYVVVGFSCGGPCYSQVFVSTDNNKTIKQFGYSQQVSGSENIIVYIKDEIFENLIIHNLINGKELVTKNPGLPLMNYGHMDSLFLEGNHLIIECQTTNNQPTRKKVLIKELFD